MASSISKQAAWVAVGSLASFAFGLISSMIMSRYLSKSDYGTYRMVMYVYDTLLVVFTLGLPRAYSFFIPRVDITNARSLILKISGIFLVMGLAMSMLLFFGAEFIANIMNNPDLTIALKYFAIVPTLLLPTMGLEGILASFERATHIAIYNIFTRILMLLCVALPVMLFRMGYKEALIGFSIASFMSFLIAEYLIFSPFRKIENRPCDVTYSVIFAFSIPLLLSSFWGIIQNSAGQFFIGRYFGSEIFAEFVNGNMEIPFIGMVIGAFATVLSPVFSKLSNKDLDPRQEIFPLWVDVFEKSAMLIYPIVMFVIVFATPIMVFLYGDQYEVSGTYFMIKSFVSFFNIIAIGPLLINVGKVGIYSNIQMLGAVAIVLFGFISVHLIHSPYAIAYVQLICTIICIILYLIIIAKYFGVTLWELVPMKTIIKMLLLCLVLLVPIKVLTNAFLLSPLGVIIVSLSSFSIGYVIIGRYVGLDYIMILKSLKK